MYDLYIAFDTVVSMERFNSMEINARLNFPKVLFDESRSSCWSISLEKAKQINTEQPSDASYARASEIAYDFGFSFEANTSNITSELLSKYGIFIIPHYSNPKWERTLSGHLLYSDDEINAIVAWVYEGGSLLVLGEHESEKYGNNLNQLLNSFSVNILHSSVIDTEYNRNGITSWPKLVISGHPTTAKVKDITFYRSGVIFGGTPLLTYSQTSSHKGENGAAAVSYGKGKIIVFADSDIFGDDSIDDGDHKELWKSVIYWLATKSSVKNNLNYSFSTAWDSLKSAVESIQRLQNDNGAIDDPDFKAIASNQLLIVKESISDLSETFQYDKEYLDSVVADLDKWEKSDFQVPDFLDSLMLFRPDITRNEEREHIAIFNMYTQNGSKKRQLEAVYFRVVWPEWVRFIESTGFDNKGFLPIKFIDFTSGYNTHSAVLFPETVSTRTTPTFQWGGIFCDREAARFRKIVNEATSLLNVNTTSEVEFILADSKICEETYILWDLVHDRTHSHGELPFDPFMIKQRMPYWLYALEELRCDLNAYADTFNLESLLIPHANLVRKAVVLDRLLRFPVSGDRVKNYDGLGGQILFAHLHNEGVISWVDNKLIFKWELLDDAVLALSKSINDLYRSGITKSKIDYWFSTYRFVSNFVPPNIASKWSSAGMDFSAPTRELIDMVLPDEFPLSIFYESLAKKLKVVIEDCKGITNNAHR